jgi:hypothetical protein
MADFPDSTTVTEIPRQIVEAEIELLIGLLDTLDADPDLEDSADQEGDNPDDEPSLGAPDARTGSWAGIQGEAYHDVDCEADDSDREPDNDDEDGGDDEWELGWTQLQARTGKYHYNWRMPWLVPDGEPSLGSTNRMNQAYWWQGSRDDREEDADFEAQCEDEGAQREGEGDDCN